jgi:hypothetical protein
MKPPTWQPIALRHCLDFSIGSINTTKLAFPHPRRAPLQPSCTMQDLTQLLARLRHYLAIDFEENVCARDGRGRLVVD